MLGEMKYSEKIFSKYFLHLLFELSAVSVFKHMLRKRLKMCIETTVNRSKQRLVLLEMRERRLKV